MVGGAVGGALRPTDVRPPGYDIWADTESADVIKLEETLEDDQRVKDYKKGADVLEVAKAMFPVPLPPRAAELGPKYARKLAWRDQLDLTLITATRFLDPYAEGALTLAPPGMSTDARIRALFALLQEHDLVSLMRFQTGADQDALHLRRRWPSEFACQVHHTVEDDPHRGFVSATILQSW